MWQLRVPEDSIFEQLQCHSKFLGKNADWPPLGKVPTQE